MVGSGINRTTFIKFASFKIDQGPNHWQFGSNQSAFGPNVYEFGPNTSQFGPNEVNIDAQWGS
ncbi:hypothetical protein MHI18_01515 [Peribacillus sp. FSL H8-0477]|uniref:hypothetical protein n=1 Tax=Peribacillus sp. FSL H8-0477 TaxID=2921388 RepID=UPI0030FC8401